MIENFMYAKVAIFFLPLKIQTESLNICLSYHLAQYGHLRDDENSLATDCRLSKKWERVRNHRPTLSHYLVLSLLKLSNVDLLEATIAIIFILHG